MQKFYVGQTLNLALYSGITFEPGVSMTTLTIRKSGNAQIISLPKLLLEQMGVGIGDRLNAILQDGKIILEPSVDDELPSLEDLFAGVTPEMFQTEEDIEWLEMPSVGKEIV